LRSDVPPNKCFIPKKQIHVWQGHNKGVAAIRWFPKTAHLILSGSMDCRVKIWEVYKDRRCVRTYFGHRQAVRDINFNNSGEKFLSAAYDRYIKLWDVETGQVVSRFTNKKVPYCVKFHPDEDKQHLFVAGMADKKIVCVSCRNLIFPWTINYSNLLLRLVGHSNGGSGPRIRQAFGCRQHHHLR